MPIARTIIAPFLALMLAGCSGEADRLGAEPYVPIAPDAPQTTATVDSMGRGFRLYYRERVDRALTAYNRFGLLGDTVAATNIRGLRVAKQGSQYEVVPVPTDNNRIGTGLWMVYSAYRVFGTRALELTLIRMLNGLTFYESVSGHPGLTARQVLPGWTRVVDGIGGTVTRTRDDLPVASPVALDPSLEAEIVDAFFADVQITYRENPAETLFNYFPAGRPGRYGVTYSFGHLPSYLHSTDCCSSLMQTPPQHAWAGAFWGNHNSRDNFPDLAWGFIVARAIASDASMPAELIAIAERAVAAGERIGDLIVANDNAIMTVAEGDDYDTLTVSGAIRPYGKAENQDLGGLNVCPMAYLARALSTDGLTGDLLEVSLPASLDPLIASTLGEISDVDCEVPDEPICRGLNDGICGRSWQKFGEITIDRIPFFEFFEEFPSLAGLLLSGFQNDLDDVVEAMVVILEYARAVEDVRLEIKSRDAVYSLTELMLDFANVTFAEGSDDLAEQRFSAAGYRARAHLPVPLEHFEDFAPSEAQMRHVESLLKLADTQPAPLLTPEQISTAIAQELADKDITEVAQRYASTYGDSPPLRLVGQTYEARGQPQSDHPWRPVERPRHIAHGHLRLFHMMPLCLQAPQIVDCSWAVLGCRPADLDFDGVVTDADTALFGDGLDLNLDGSIDEVDTGYMAAAQGCWY